MSIEGGPLRPRVPPTDARHNGIAKRAGLAIIAIAAGVVIGILDSGPGWDSTGITAGALFLTTAAVAWAGRDRPWLWALLVGLPTPILDIVRTGNAGSVLALGFAAAGAGVGWAARRI